MKADDLHPIVTKQEALLANLDRENANLKKVLDDTENRVLKQLENAENRLLKQLEKADQVHKELTTQVQNIKSQLDKTEQRLVDHIAQYEKSDNRRWGTIGFFIAGLVTLIVNLILLITRK